VTDSTYESGKLVYRWKLEPVCVHGGWQVRWVRWALETSGWEPEDRPSDDSTVYETLEAAQAAVAFLVKHGKGRSVA
jgi:hypothetical protein